jgi:transcriptional regulator with XRE-family HTH domain
MGANKNQNIIGPVVRRMRVEAGLSQEQMAGKIQVAGWDLSRGGLSKVEAQLRRVNDAELLVLAQVFKCPVQDLYPKRVKGLGEVLRQGGV